jgi:hypothetical protein
VVAVEEVEDVRWWLIVVELVKQPNDGSLFGKQLRLVFVVVFHEEWVEVVEEVVELVDECEEVVVGVVEVDALLWWWVAVRKIRFYGIDHEIS